MKRKITFRKSDFTHRENIEKNFMNVYGFSEFRCRSADCPFQMADMAHIIWPMNGQFQSVRGGPGTVPGNPDPNHLWNGEFLKIVAAVFCQK